MYDSFVFDGAGKVTVGSFLNTAYDFFQVGDTVIVFPDKEIFVFLKKDDRTLQGISTWVKGSVYTLLENDTIAPATPRPDNETHLKQYYRFYQLLGNGAPSLATYMQLNTDRELNAAMNTLCDEGFSKACLTLANAEMVDGVLMKYLMDPSTDKKPLPANMRVVAFYERVIKLNDPNGYIQLGAYYTMLNQTEKAKAIFEAGCENGIAQCCFALAGFDIESRE